MSSFINRPTTRVIAYQLLIILSLIIIDLYVFRGFYTSKIHIKPDAWVNDQTHSCKFQIEKIANDKYLFTFKNNSILPKYFLNYRNEEYLQKITDTMFFDYSGKNLFPAYGFDYYYNFDCGTGLGLSSINPLETFKIEKNYKDIINEFCHFGTIMKTSFFNKRTEKPYTELSFEEIDSLIINGSELVSKTDSVQIEYYIKMNSSFSKNGIYSVSNKINIGLNDLLSQYKNKYYKNN